MPTQNTDDKTVLTREEARQKLEEAGVSIKEFAARNGLNPKTVYEVLAGRKRCIRGEAHRAAVLLGIKDGVISQ